MRTIFARVALACCVALLTAQIVTAAVPLGTPLAGFEDTLVASISSPTGFAFTPDGRILVTQQTGRMRVIRNATLSGTTPQIIQALDLSQTNRVCTNSERGLLGVAVDPDFGISNNRWIYLYYTYNKFGQTANACNTNNSTTPVNRVSRFRLEDNDTVALASEQILLDNIVSNNGNHNGGDLKFGHDGNLYVSIGDAGCDIHFLGDLSKCAGNNAAARDRSYLLGVIARIAPDGSVPADNPYATTGEPCRATGRNTAGKPCRETFAWGLRNPFRIAMDPNASGTRFFINDVGQDRWEEIDESKAGVDYGWNICEGKHLRNQDTACPAAANSYTNPVFEYRHDTNSGLFVGCNSITGGAFVPNGVWPAAYTGVYLFGDYGCGKIFSITPNGSGGYTAANFVTNVGGAIGLEFGPYNGTQALYYTTYGSGGQLRRVFYQSGANRSPTAQMSATPDSGDVPLEVEFSASGSSDPDSDPLTYSWNFGDGHFAVGGLNVSHTYEITGTYTATLAVSDGKGGSNMASKRIDVGNLAPEAQILTPGTDLRYAVGQQLVLTGSATDREDGTLAGDKLSWEVLLHHDDHTHPYFPATKGLSVTITAPQPEALNATETSYLEVILTATDSRGLTSTITRTLLPRLVNITLESQPAGAQFVVNGDTITAPRTLVSWENYQLSIATPPIQTGADGRPLIFTGWSDGAGSQRDITTPGSPATYTAVFAPAQKTFLPHLSR
ncbi:MAG TPA: PQQ-dependent sugar dehydrogenase [Roseiflexaceae bacterium]|nr:PQQ-dependent sugar dehydrogenase [Roseiflexaceae bacterium]